MKRILLSALLIVTFVLTACESQDSVNDPVSSGGDNTALLKAVENLDLSDDQIALIDEMYWLDEDLSTLLDPMQLHTLNTIMDKLSPTAATARDPRGRGFDMGAMMYLRLILKANPDMTEEEKEALIELIKASHQKRLELIEQYKDDPETLRQMLKDEHDALIAAMNALLSAEQLQNVEDLKAEIKAKREERRQKWTEMRINFTIKIWTRILGLDETQAEAIRQLLIAHHAAVRAAIEAADGDREALKQALEELREKLDADIQELLTEEQKERWEKMKTAGRKWRRGGTGGGGIGTRR